MLSDEDKEWLAQQGLQADIASDGGMTNLILKDYSLPSGFDRDIIDLLVRLPAGFPDVPPDMFWVDPEIKLSKTGEFAPASGNFESHAGRKWQRFSRHFTPGAWRPGTDSLQSWILCIGHLLEKDVSI